MTDARFAPVAEILAAAVTARTTPGAQLSVRWHDGSGWRAWDHCVGSLRYEPGAASVTPATRYDLASVTKVFVATTALLLADAGRLDPLARLGDVLPGARNTPAGGLSLETLATHRGELPAFLPYFRDVDPARAGEPGVRTSVLEAVMRTGLEPTGGAERYSDIGYILLGEAMSSAGGATLDELLATTLLAPLGLAREIQFRGVIPAPDDASIAPTERCPWRGRMVQGQVHDENAYALGGVAGHAGLFGNAASLGEFGGAMLDARAGRRPWLRTETFRAALAPRPGGTHRFGWDGIAAHGSSAGSHASPDTFGHLGFTGTSLWCDPTRDVAVALLTNRVHPTRENIQIRALRPAVHDAVFSAIDPRRRP